MAKTIPNGSILYIDTNILIDYLTLPTTHPRYVRCDSLFSDILTGKLVGYVSTWTIAETVDVMKRMVVDQGNPPPTSKDIMLIENTVLTTLKMLQIGIIDADKIIQQRRKPPLIERVSNLVITTKVDPPPNSKQQAKSLGVTDCVHEWIAENSGMTHIITRDKGYKNIPCQTTNCLIGDEY